MLHIFLCLIGCTSATGFWSGDCVGSGDQSGWIYHMTLDLLDDGGDVSGTTTVQANDDPQTVGAADGFRSGDEVSLDVGLCLVDYQDSCTLDGTITEDSLDGAWVVSGTAGTLDFACSLSR